MAVDSTMPMAVPVVTAMPAMPAMPEANANGKAWPRIIVPRAVVVRRRGNVGNRRGRLLNVHDTLARRLGWGNCGRELRLCLCLRGCRLGLWRNAVRPNALG